MFVLHRELVAMNSGAQNITDVLEFREQLPQNMAWVMLNVKGKFYQILYKSFG